MGARQYFQIVAISYATLVVLGLLPATQTLFGLVPLWGNDVWFHLALAVVAGYFGFVNPDDIPRRRT